MDEDQYRDILASNAAHAALIYKLLSWSMEGFTAEQVLILGDETKRGARSSVPTVTIEGNAAASERLADLVVRTHQKIDMLVDEAVAAVLEVLDEK